MNKLKKILGVLILIGFIVIFYKYSRSTDIPILKKLNKGETVESVVHKIEGEVNQRLKGVLQENGFGAYPTKLLLVALKEERKLKVYGEQGEAYKLLKTYDFTAFSGKLGPKLKEGDRQIPEGIYQIEYLNPNSSYYLSMKVNYPNDFDKQKGIVDRRTNLGSDIFIHGRSVTIGCIPIGDEAIEEVFFLSAKAIGRGIKVIISPRDFRVNHKSPVIEGLTWENELYEMIKEELRNLPI